MSGSAQHLLAAVPVRGGVSECETTLAAALFRSFIVFLFCLITVLKLHSVSDIEAQKNTLRTYDNNLLSLLSQTYF